jgi:hypothetical protein
MASELIPHTGERPMLPVLDLDPVTESTAAIGVLAMLGDHALKAHQAGMPEQVRADLSLLEWRFISGAKFRIVDGPPWCAFGQFGISERCQNGTQGRTDDCIPWWSIL